MDNDEQEPARSKSRIDHKDITKSILERSRLKGPRADAYGRQPSNQVGCSFQSEGKQIIRQPAQPQQLRWGLNGIDMLEASEKFRK